MPHQIENQKAGPFLALPKSQLWSRARLTGCEACAEFVLEKRVAKTLYQKVDNSAATNFVLFYVVVVIHYEAISGAVRNLVLCHRCNITHVNPGVPGVRDVVIIHAVEGEQGDTP